MSDRRRQLLTVRCPRPHRCTLAVCGLDEHGRLLVSGRRTSNYLGADGPARDRSDFDGVLEPDAFVPLGCTHGKWSLDADDLRARLEQAARGGRREWLMAPRRRHTAELLGDTPP